MKNEFTKQWNKERKTPEGKLKVAVYTAINESKLSKIESLMVLNEIVGNLAFDIDCINTKALLRKRV